MLANDSGRQWQKNKGRLSFSFSLGIIPPLVVTGLRCRDGYIRRQAIGLLERCKRREVLWDSRLAARSVRQVVETEERSNICGGGDEARTTRVREVTAILDDEDGAMLEFY